VTLGPSSQRIFRWRISTVFARRCSCWPTSQTQRPAARPRRSTPPARPR
jgi:hypothetical protein